jgi:hypothetical protein
MAAVGHCISQAKHCMQSGSRAGSDFFSEVGCPAASTKSYSDTGQTSTHTPSPVHTSQSTATLVPWMPCFVGGSTGPQTLCPLCSPATCLFFWKSGSIGKNFHLSLIRDDRQILGFLLRILFNFFWHQIKAPVQ